MAQVFLGYRAKAHHPRAGPWELAHLPNGVAEVCSVGDCIAKPPPGWSDAWDFNRAGCFATLGEAAAKIPVGEDYDVYAYWLLPFVVTGTYESVDADLRKVFDVGLPDLPKGGEPLDFNFLGWDVVDLAGSDAWHFSHSPLSCNGLAREVRVNQYCLVDTEEEALSLSARCNREPPEPGIYYAIHVERRPRKP